MCGALMARVVRRCDFFKCGAALGNRWLTISRSGAAPTVEAAISVPNPSACFIFPLDTFSAVRAQLS